MLGIPSCKQVTELSSLQLDESLPRLQRVALRVHLMMCQSCRRYVKQMELTSDIVQRWLTRREMPEAVKQRLLAQWREQRPQDPS
ncbi:MAG: zf-HC2 domain-containing protein [Gammaproteobacteria bacterium]|nr:zf-HC2 domain-containing protein [Gammaproteobacteria bacterium]NVK89229.1 zf-HC2 domain-containing protein [Gammaproteobacteria bacterium]